MSSCEKCWADASRDPYNDVPRAYARLIEKRRDRPCTPEEQAGPDAGVCPWCHRRTLHQHTGECMTGACYPARRTP